MSTALQELRNTASDGLGNSVEIEALLPGTVKQAFDAWTSEPQLLRWWDSFDKRNTLKVRFENRVPGRIEIETQLSDGSRLLHQGDLEVFDAPRELAFDWQTSLRDSEGALHQIDKEPGKVRILFAPHAQGCRFDLLHSGLGGAASCLRQLNEWTHSIALCAEYLHIGRSALPLLTEDQLYTAPSQARRTLQLQIDLDAEPGEIFDWLTQAELLTRWFSQRAETEPCHGGHYTLEWDMPAQEKLLRKGHYVACAPQRAITHDWYPWGWDDSGEPRGPDPTHALTRVSWRLDPLPNDGTRVTLKHSGWESGPEWDRLLGGQAGSWEFYLKNLKSVIEGGPDLRSQDARSD